MDKDKRSLTIFVIILVALLIINLNYIIEFIQERGWVAVLILFVIVPVLILIFKWLKSDNII
jgi:hypothetical protein